MYGQFYYAAAKRELRGRKYVKEKLKFSGLTAYRLMSSWQISHIPTSSREMENESLI